MYIMDERQQFFPDSKENFQVKSSLVPVLFNCLLYLWCKNSYIRHHILPSKQYISDLHNINWDNSKPSIFVKLSNCS